MNKKKFEIRKRLDYIELVLIMNDDDVVWEVSEGEESANEVKNELG